MVVVQEGDLIIVDGMKGRGDVLFIVSCDGSGDGGGGSVGGNGEESNHRRENKQQ